MHESAARSGCSLVSSSFEFLAILLYFSGRLSTLSFPFLAFASPQSSVDVRGENLRTPGLVEQSAMREGAKARIGYFAFSVVCVGVYGGFRENGGYEQVTF